MMSNIKRPEWTDNVLQGLAYCKARGSDPKSLKCNKTYPDMGDIYRVRDSFRHEKYSFLDKR